MKSLQRNTIWLGIFLLALALAAAGTEAAAKKPKGADKIKNYEKRLKQILAPVAYRYNPLGKPDPFRPFLRSNTSAQKSAKSRRPVPRPDECSNPLECIDVGQLTLVAVVTGNGNSAWAMAQDASGIGYLLKKGMKVGYRGGRIVAILPEKVIIRETTEDLSGKKMKRDRILYLHPEEQE